MESDSVLEIQTEYREGILFVRLEGKLVSKTVPIFQKEFEGLIHSGITNIVFNLQDLRMIDMYGIEALFQLYETIHDKSGHSLICGMNHRVNKNLKQSKILNYIYEISDELNAIKVMKWSNQN